MREISDFKYFVSRVGSVGMVRVGFVGWRGVAGMVGEGGLVREGITEFESGVMGGCVDISQCA